MGYNYKTDAHNHWSYVGDVLKMHGVNERIIRYCELGYLNGFEDGFQGMDILVSWQAFLIEHGGQYWTPLSTERVKFHYDTVHQHGAKHRSQLG